MARVEEEKLPKELVSSAAFIDYNTSISNARKSMREMPAAVVRRNGEYYGIVDSRALHGSASLSLQGSEKVGKITIKAPRVSSTTSVGDMAYYLYKLKLKNLPYVYGGKIVGVVERSTLLRMLLSLNALNDIRVREAMSSPVLAIDSNARLSQALNTMSARKVSRLIVLENGRFAGMITNSEMHSQYTTENERQPLQKRRYSPSNIVVDSVMEKNVSTINGDASLAEAARFMVENGISSLVVTVKNNPYGILTTSDILEKVVAGKRIEQRKVFVSGFDDYSYQYEESVIEELKALMDQMERMHELEIDYATVNLKRIKNSAYQMHGRISLGKRGTLRVDSEGKDFHEAFSNLLKRFKTRMIKEKDNIVSAKRRRERGIEYQQ